jgi:hypothetical protein
MLHLMSIILVRPSSPESFVLETQGFEGRHVANLFVAQTYEGQSDIHCELKSSKVQKHL